MTRIAPPLLGYNNNVRYLGRTFHIQTEDSGTKYARIMTHLFIDGGHIVKSTRTEYGSVVGQPNMAETVRHMMKEQHKNMFLALRAGEFDELIDRFANGGQVATHSAAPTVSQVPRLRAESLPSLSFGANGEAKTTPGLQALAIESGSSPELAVSTSQQLIQQSALQSKSATLAAKAAPSSASVRTAESAKAGSAQREVVKSESGIQVTPARSSPERPGSPARIDAPDPPEERASAGSIKRPSVRPRKAKTSSTPAPRRGRAADEPVSADPGIGQTNSADDRPSEQSSRALPVRPPTSIAEAIDPRSQSIFGEATAGRQTLDEVILSFLEDEET